MQIQSEKITGLIHFIRGEKVILDIDLARLYEVEVKTLKRAVKRNYNRFPSDFMFELSKEENYNLRYHIGTSSWGGSRYQSFAFTEQGVAMLSSVLHSERAVTVNIAIMRAFVQMRKFFESNRELAMKIEELEKTVGVLDENVQLIFETIKQLIHKKSEPMEPVGFKIGGTRERERKS